MEIAIGILGIIYAVLLWNEMGKNPIYNSKLMKRIDEIKNQPFNFKTTCRKYKRV